MLRLRAIKQCRSIKCFKLWQFILRHYSYSSNVPEYIILPTLPIYIISMMDLMISLNHWNYIWEQKKIEPLCDVINWWPLTKSAISVTQKALIPLSAKICCPPCCRSRKTRAESTTRPWLRNRAAVSNTLDPLVITSWNKRKKISLIIEGIWITLKFKPWACV